MDLHSGAPVMCSTMTTSEITVSDLTWSEASQVHDWVVYRLGDILGSVGHNVKIHKITPATGKERTNGVT